MLLRGEGTRPECPPCAVCWLNRQLRCPCPPLPLSVGTPVWKTPAAFPLTQDRVLALGHEGHREVTLHADGHGSRRGDVSCRGSKRSSSRGVERTAHAAEAVVHTWNIHVHDQCTFRRHIQKLQGAILPRLHGLLSGWSLWYRVCQRELLLL